MSHRWLIGASLGAHLFVAAGLGVTGLWRLERMDPGRLHMHELVIMPSPPAPSGGPVAPSLPTIPRKLPKVIPKEVVQPDRRPTETPAPTTGGADVTGTGAGSGDPTSTGGTCIENCAPSTTPVEPVCGNGAVEAGEDCDDGNTRDGDGCTAACRREPQPTTKFVIPSVLQGLRTSGETQISPATSTQNRMLRDGVTHTSGSVKVCIATDGSVASVKLLASTRYGGYDAMLLAAVRDWRYRPYMLGGTPVPACSVVTFNYTIK